MTWSDLIEEVKNKSLTSAGWTSDQKALLKLFTYAKENDLKVPDNLKEFQISNFREIIAEGKIAINHHDNGWLDRLFNLAATKTVMQIRVELGKLTIEIVPVEPIVEEGQKYLLAKFTVEQFKRISRLSDQYFIFDVKGGEI